MYVYMAFMCISPPFHPSCSGAESKQHVYYVPGPYKTYFYDDILYVFPLTKNSLSSVCSSSFCPQLQSTHLSVLQQKECRFFFRIVSRFLNGETIADKLCDWYHHEI